MAIGKSTVLPSPESTLPRHPHRYDLGRAKPFALAGIERLRKQLEEALRANKRSAAPSGEPKSNPKQLSSPGGGSYTELAST